MQILSQIIPVAGSLLSVKKLLDEAFAEGPFSFSAQGISLENGCAPFSAFQGNLGSDDKLASLKGQVIRAWRQGWCEYHEKARSRGRPPVRAAYYIRVEFVGARIKTDCAHKFFTLLLTRTESTRYGRFLIAVSRPTDAALVSIVLHPVSQDGRMIRLEKDFPQKFHQRVEVAFHSDPERVVRAWLSS